MDYSKISIYLLYQNELRVFPEEEVPLFFLAYQQA
tara:strand:+ start:380 stop:484 length:105 start_codon:yes stop_codon:yes gene_type:complete